MDLAVAAIEDEALVDVVEMVGARTWVAAFMIAGASIYNQVKPKPVSVLPKVNVVQGFKNGPVR